MEQMLLQRSEDLPLEALESGYKQQNQPTGPQRLPNAVADVVNDVFMHGAQHGSLQVVQWGVSTFTTLRFYGALRAAVENGHMEVVQFLHLRVLGFGLGVNESTLLDTAAAHGQLEALEWVYANRRDPNASCSLIASKYAARHGHLETIKWVQAHFPKHRFCVILEQPALDRQHHVLEWVFQEDPQTGAFVAMKTAALQGDRDVLAWLHDRYPRERIPLRGLLDLSLDSQLEAVKWLIAMYPERYAEHGFDIGTTCGDMNLAKQNVPLVRISRSNAKREMHEAAGKGFLGLIQWVSHRFQGYLPTLARAPLRPLEHCEVIPEAETRAVH